MSRILACTSFFLAGVVWAQQSPPEDRKNRQPIYDITVVSRTTKAINYGHSTQPTKIGFQGTVLLPAAKGEATVENKRGSTLVNAHFEKLPAPQRFGLSYLTYVLWAISPDGRAQNLGEIFLDTKENGKLTATSNLQAFALIVTAEPHFSVSQPSDAVVMENVVRPDTIGRIEEVSATYELLPRKQFVYDKDNAAPPAGKMVSREEYDSLTAIYQAQNAVQIAESQGAAKYAPERLAHARDLLNTAKSYPKSQKKQVIAVARQATQVAEDARRIAEKRSQEPTTQEPSSGGRP